MTLESAGSKASALTAMLGRKSVVANHDAPPSIVFQTPPETAPAYITLESLGSMSSARVRPPTLPGPRKRQTFVLGRPGFSPAAEDAGLKPGLPARSEEHTSELQ